MTKNEKKELFLLLLKSWFDDNTSQVNIDNCIGFYHYLLDCLEFEAQFPSLEEPGLQVFLHTFIELLYDFPIHSDYITKDKKGLKNAIVEFGINVDLRKINIYMHKINELYSMFKEEYFI